MKKSRLFHAIVVLGCAITTSQLACGGPDVDSLPTTPTLGRRQDPDSGRPAEPADSGQHQLPELGGDGGSSGDAGWRDAGVHGGDAGVLDAGHLSTDAGRPDAGFDAGLMIDSDAGADGGHDEDGGTDGGWHPTK